MVTYVAKGRQPFLFSEVVQRYSGDEKVICRLNSFSQFRWTIRDWSQACDVVKLSLVLIRDSERMGKLAMYSSPTHAKHLRNAPFGLLSVLC